MWDFHIIHNYGNENISDAQLKDGIDIVNKKSIQGDDYKKVFLHFKNWNNGDYTDQIKERLINGNNIKVVYDFPWFWKISINKYR